MEVDDDTNSNTSDDPVVAEYNIFITPQMQEQLYLLQYPTRERKQPYTAANAALPNELRIKPKIGFVEVDIGVTTAANFDKIKGLQWGQALKHAKDSKAKGFGLSSGFGKGNEEGNMKVLVSGDGEGRRRKDDGDVDDMLREFETKKERGGVLVKQTLGGQIKRPEEGKPFYMCGTFRGSKYCHVLLSFLSSSPSSV
jgi:DNA-directed RNA polymerase-3 subunit RPC5